MHIPVLKAGPALKPDNFQTTSHTLSNSVASIFSDESSHESPADIAVATVHLTLCL